MKNTFALLIALTSLCLFSCTKLNNSSKPPKLDPNNPVSLKLWHYYNGTQQKALNELIDQFNSTKGKDLGIYIEGFSKSSIAELDKALIDSANGTVGSEKLPDIFTAYADTAYKLNKSNILTDLTKYFTPQELSKYVESYIDEGYFLGDSGLYLFPTAKSTEIFMMNKTDWEPFASDCGFTLEDLHTTEGVTKVAEAYYQWSDGKAFYGRDSLSNYFLLSFSQMGEELVKVTEDGVIINKDKEKYRRLWDNYYIPYIKGYFGMYGKFRSDDVKTGDLLAYTGSSSSSTYFPSKVISNESEKDIDFIVLPAPIMENGENINVQQGAGMAIAKSDPVHEYASCIFLKWFTETENNIRFACESSYLPVMKMANITESLNAAIKKYNLKIQDRTYQCFTLIMDNFENTSFYTPKAYEASFQVRNILDTELILKSISDKKQIDALINQGYPREEALKDYLSDQSFNNWYNEFISKLVSTIQG